MGKESLSSAEVEELAEASCAILHLRHPPPVAGGRGWKDHDLVGHDPAPHVVIHDHPVRARESQAGVREAVAQ